MSMGVDIADLLKAWPYDPEKDARIVQGRDGREILQVRSPMGIEQYELDGRPDGARPYGRESVLEHQLYQLEQAKLAGKGGEFELSPAECTELFNEGTIYYFRYVRLFQLRDWPRTLRDTSRNLRAFDLVHTHARREEDQNYLEKWRPYIIRVNAAAGALLALDRHEHDRALVVVQSAMSRIEALDDLEEDTFRFERERSLAALRELAEQIQKNRPLSRLEQLERQLRKAIDRQEFEKAAVLRDQLREIKSASTLKPGG
jgi:hypothetical protein